MVPSMPEAAIQSIAIELHRACLPGTEADIGLYAQRAEDIAGDLP